MKIYIPTRGRWHPWEQRGYRQLEDAGMKPVLVVDSDEKEHYGDYRHVVMPDHTVDVNPLERISVKRQYIIELTKQELIQFGDGKVAQVDDDVTIATVKFGSDNMTCKINDLPSKDEIQAEYGIANELLDKYAHGGVHTRHFVNSAPRKVQLNRGYYRQISFFNLSKMKPIPRYGGGGSEDVKFMIELLNQGLDYFILTSCCMVEKQAKRLPSHFTQEQKDLDFKEVWDKHAAYVKHLRNGRVTLSYSKILKDAKKRLGIA